MNLEAAGAYAQRSGLQALLVIRDGAAVFASYADGFDAETPHLLYSGTKSFWGPAALAAQDDGLLDLDEPVAATFPAWGEGRRGRVILRQLLSLTAGIGFGGLGNAVPTYEKVLSVEIKDEPGTRFTYGGIPLQVFGAVLARKLAVQHMTPHDYLKKRVLAPAGVNVASWRTLSDGTQPLPTGAAMSAPAWGTYGQYVLGQREQLAPCFTPSQANARYGLGWWLSPLPAYPDIAYASGSGGQALYVIPSQRAVVVKFATRAKSDHAAFLRRLVS
ncbi:MAG: beta-lactamase family protein [Candidatus Eremiobacteraeota bacterium]|nr:beta-lactamase family protein [Candidatus Eremiobacteraeota bacterium]MBC5804449.1 beta-lactamase family protein [Candidatus Eremiobacteraeota bacterium]MBC5821206.1 beta-lactamase family protein [Candidatus Eremiobacteraeota bacterium]